MRHPFRNSLAILLVVLPLTALTAGTSVVITEIHYHPIEEPAFNSDGTPVLDLTDDVHEFVEIQNVGTATVDLQGWKLAGGISYTFPEGSTLSAGGFRVIAKDPDALADVYSLAAGTVLGPYSGQLGNNRDTVRLRDTSGTTIDSVTYGSTFPWPASADAFGAQDRFTGLTSSNYQYKGRSLQRVSMSWASGDPANWLASPLTGPTPGAAQAVTRTVPKPVIISQSAVQTDDEATIVRAGNEVTVNCVFSSTESLSNVTLEYFIDLVNSTSETRTSVVMTDLGDGSYTGTIPGQTDRSVVRYRFKANRGDGLEVVSPREDDPQIAPVGTSGALEAWHGYFVTPVRTSSYPIYDVFVSTTALTQLNTNITQTPRRVTIASAYGQPRAVPYVTSGSPEWNGTQAAVFAYNGELWDIHIRYHGSLYHRAASNNSFKLHFPENHSFNEQSSWFITGHGSEFIEAQKLNRLLGLPASKMRTVAWYYNSNSMVTRSEQGEYAGEMLDEYHELMQQLDPGSDKEESGELYKVVGNRDSSQNNNEGPYTRGDEAPLAANSGWTQLERYEWTMSLQNHGWKGSKPVRDLIEGMWTARGDTPSTHNFSSSSTNLANAKAWFNENWDMDTTLTSMALLEWMSIWDDAAQNHFFWLRADGKWSRLGWDYDEVMSASTSTGGGPSGGGTTNGGATQTIYGGEYGATTVFDGVNWWKDTFYKCFRSEYQERLWELNNSFFDPDNLTALGCSQAATFAASRQSYVNTQLSSFGTYYKPVRPTNQSPSTGTVIVGETDLTTSAYSHPQSTAHASTCWEIRTEDGDYEEPVLRLTSTTALTSLAVPFDQLTYGETYDWRVTHIDAGGHPSVVSAETSFTWGTASGTAGTLVLNEMLADNRNTVQNGTSYPDYVELRNNGSTALALAGYALTDDPLEPAKYTFPSGTSIAAKGYLLVWCDDDTDTAGLHSGFGLDADGDQLLLLDSSGAIVDSLTFGPQAPDIAVGRIVDGTGGWQANTPTPGIANSAETLGSVSSLRINEWMADPAYGDDWFEIHNPDNRTVALSGMYLSDTPSEPTVTQIPALSFIAAGGYTRFYADGRDEGGNHCDFKLSRSGESLVLTASNGATTIDTINFSTQDLDVSEGRLPDGGSTIIAFAGQTTSPGEPNWAPAAVLISEVLAHAYPPFEDAVEIYNPTTASVDIGSWWLSDDLLRPMKYQIPAGTTVPAEGYLVIYENTFGTGDTPFALNAWGDEAVLSAVDDAGALTGYAAVARFGLSTRNRSFGRVEATGLDAKSNGADYWLQTGHTLGRDTPDDEADFRTGTGAANALPDIGQAIINEIMYHPPDADDGTDNTDDEFIEFYNPTTSAVDLSGWRLRGDSDFTFPSGTNLAAGGYLLLVSFDPDDGTKLSAFQTTYALSTDVDILGPYSGNLANSTHELELASPIVLDETDTFLRMDKVEYRDIEPWPTEADGDGESLQRTSSTMIGNTAANWLADTPTPGAANDGVLSELTVTTVSSLPGGVVGKTYLYTLNASGGKAPYSWSLTSGTVSGLSLSAAGILEGTPTAAGTCSLTAEVTDNDGSTADRTFQFTVAEADLAIVSAAALPDGTVAEVYSYTLTASGGTTPYFWTVASGELPDGVSLSGAGVFSGTPVLPGTYEFTIKVTDNGGLDASKIFSLIIPVPPLTITSTSPLTGAELDTTYSQALTAVGGEEPYLWTVENGSLPDGISMSTDGTLNGTPTAVGVCTFTIQVADNVTSTATKAFSLTVVPQPLAITTVSISGGIVEDACDQTLSASGGVTPYSWSVVDGTLSTGISLSNSGVLSGTFAAAGECTFTIQVADSLNTTATRSFSVTVSASGPLDHFTWSEALSERYAGQPFGVSLTARDTAERVVSSFSGTLDVSAASGESQVTSPILVTEITDGYEDQFELQNVTDADVDSTGWFVLLGDSLTDINTLNAVTYELSGTLAAGELLRVTESSSSTADGRVYFGGSIDWSSSAGDSSKGWIMLFDAACELRDFVVIGWTETELAGLSVEVDGEAVTSAGQWSGDPVLPGSRTTGGNTFESWQRIGSSDTNTSADWEWRYNTDSSDATSFNVTNTGLDLPWDTATPLTLSPVTMTLTDGECLGYLTIAECADEVRLEAVDSSDHSGESGAFTVLAGDDADEDGMPDAWEEDHGLTVGEDDGALDPDNDGQTNLDEYMAGTDPFSATSVLAITALDVPDAEKTVITWSGIAGKLYQLSTSDDLANWTVLEPPILVTTTGDQTTTVPTDGVSRLFVRVEICP